MSFSIGPLLNKGTASTEAERDDVHLHGLLPPHVGTLDEQVARRLRVLRRFETDFERYAPSCASCRTPTRRSSTRSSCATSSSCCRSCTPRRWAKAASASARLANPVLRQPARPTS